MTCLPNMDISFLLLCKLDVQGATGQHGERSRYKYRCATAILKRQSTTKKHPQIKSPFPPSHAIFRHTGQVWTFFLTFLHLATEPDFIAQQSPSTSSSLITNTSLSIYALYFPSPALRNSFSTFAGLPS